MTICLAGQSAVSLMRMIRQVGGSSPYSSLCFSPDVGDRALLAQMSCLLGSSPDRPLELLFTDPSRRMRRRGVRSRVWSTPLPPGGVRLVSGGLMQTAGLEVASVQIAQDTASLQGLEGLFGLVDLFNEFCGSYARDPLDPQRGNCAFNLRAFTDVAHARSTLAELGGASGLTLARRAASLARDGAASPMESLLATLFGSPAELGGIPLGRMLLNCPLERTAAQSRVATNRRMRPDVYFPDLGIAFEYNGSLWHHSTEARLDDTDRIQDYVSCGVLMYPLSSRNVCSVDAVNAFARKVVEGSRAREGNAWARRMRTIIDDPDLVRRRACML